MRGLDGAITLMRFVHCANSKKLKKNCPVLQKKSKSNYANAGVAIMMMTLLPTSMTSIWVFSTPKT
jgi:hypothetical protein